MDPRWRYVDYGRWGGDTYRVGPTWGLGRFELRAGHFAWRTDNHIGDEGLVAFATRGVEIRQAGRPRAVANANVAMFYDPHTVYQRRLVDPYGDVCRHFSLSRAHWHDIVAHADPRYDGGTLFPYPRGPVRPELRLELELLLRRVEEGAVDELSVQETLLGLAAELVRDAVGRDRPPPDGPTERRHREQVRAMEAALSVRYREALPLEAIAASADLSSYHAARLFRRHTGASIHAYRDELRLRAALPLLAGAERLDELGRSLGFASHAHFTDRFRRRFGATPSAVRDGLR